jgi:hypothetical protein
MKNKRGNTTLLVENIIFLVLNLLFFAILITFLIQQGSGAALLEQTYSKKVALLIDQAEPGMIIKLNLEEGMKVAARDKILPPAILTIQGNFVKVKLSNNGGQEYHFFNEVDVKIFPETDNNGDYSGIYALTINRKLADGVRA